MTSSLMDFKDLYGFFIILARFAPALLLLPGFGDKITPLYIRGHLGILIAFLLTPLLSPALPSIPENALAILGIMGKEMVVGAFIGLIGRTFFYVLEAVGSFISMQIGFSSAMAFQPLTQEQSSSIATFLLMTGIFLCFLMDLHHEMIISLFKSYSLFLPGTSFFEEMSPFFIKILSSSFILALQLSAPILFSQLIFFISIGILNRLIPQIQVFFVSLPLQIILGLGVFFLALAGLFNVFMEAYQTFLINFEVPS